MDEKEFEDVTKEEMQRFLIKEAQRGSTEFEAYKNLMEILGIEFPKFWSGVVLTGNPITRTGVAHGVLSAARLPFRRAPIGVYCS